ncbi:MAG: glyoxalase [Acidobacteria bacterium]|nr:MAG: glyoxalase [Acidobacteriota bacterium]
MPNLVSVLETSLYVEDLDRSVHFYRTLFNFAELNADTRFCALNVAGHQVLLLFRRGSSHLPTQIPGGIIPPHGGSGSLHLAFSVCASDLPDWEKKLRDQNVSIESRVHWPRGGQSIYFRDPDDHLIELVTPGCWLIY